MKKIRFLICCIVLLFVLTGCDSLLSGIKEYLYADTYDSSKYAAEYTDGWQYQQLDADLKDYYGSMYTAITDTVNTESVVEFLDSNNHNQAVNGVRVRFLNAKMSDKEIVKLFEAFFRDNPQFFYLNREYRIEGRTIGDSGTFYDTIILQYLMPMEQRVAAITTFNNALDNMAKGVPNENDDYVKELFLYDRLAQHCIYDNTAAQKDDSEDPMAYTAYGALVDGEAVCEGYAKAMQLLLTRAGITATVVSGDSLWNVESHMWNLVQINGQYYYLDPTWSDNTDQSLHTYFNITTEMLNRTHKIKEENVTLPTCTATQDNYFVRTGCFVDTYERKKIAQIIANHILDGETLIQLQFSPKTFDNGQLFLSNGELTFEMVNEYLKPHKKSLWNYTLWTDKESYILTIGKS